jgi:3-dehydroquinate dehydratase
MRGKVQTEIFGPMTLPEYDERIRGFAKELGVDIEIFHSNVEGEVINRLYAAMSQAPTCLVWALSAQTGRERMLRWFLRQQIAKFV